MSSKGLTKGLSLKRLPSFTSKKKSKESVVEAPAPAPVVPPPAPPAVPPPPPLEQIKKQHSAATKLQAIHRGQSARSMLVESGVDEAAAFDKVAESRESELPPAKPEPAVPAKPESAAPAKPEAAAKPPPNPGHKSPLRKLSGTDLLAPERKAPEPHSTWGTLRLGVLVLLLALAAVRAPAAIEHCSAAPDASPLCPLEQLVAPEREWLRSLTSPPPPPPPPTKRRGRR